MVVPSESSRGDWAEIDQLLDMALEREDGEREGAVRRAASNSRIAEEVLALLTSAEASDGAAFLESAADPAEAAPLLPAGSRLGAWKIVSSIGQGGMGEVYRAERGDGLYEQQAALKLMKPLPAEYWPLFDDERRLLARLDHPGIARLLDGGLAPDGRPWMVMEYASGRSIDAWAQQRKSSPRNLVRQIIDVCAAIASAHTNLIVHCDLKPSNILVDDAGRSRVIDFGVAQITGLERRGEMPLSLDYAAPELLSGAQATTASDIYSLGACLYALIAGKPPLHLSRDPMPVAVRRAIQEVPPPLSHQLSRGARTGLVKDLDRILDRALAKRPDDRYRSIVSFCEDLDRALAGKAVGVRRSERGYVAARFLHQYRWPAIAASALVVSLAAGLGVSMWQTQEARAERQVALRQQERLEAVQQYLYFMLRDAADAGDGTNSSAREILETAAQQVIDLFAADPERGAPIMHALAELYLYLGDYEAAGPLLVRVADAEETEPVVRASANYDLAQYYLRTSNVDAADDRLALAHGFWNTDPVMWRRRLVDSRLVEARILRDRGDIDAGIALLNAHLAQRVALSGRDHRETGVYYNELGVLFNAAGRRDEAARAFGEAWEVWEAISLGNSPDALNTLNNLAAVEVLSGRYARAEPLFRRAIDIRRDLYGPSAATAALLNNYGKTLIRLGRAEEALPPLREAISMARDHAGVGSLHYASAVAGLSEALFEVGDYAQALAIASDGHAQVQATLGRSHPGTAIVGVALARAVGATSPDQAAALLDNAEAAFAPLGAGGQPQLEAIGAIRRQLGLRPSA